MKENTQPILYQGKLTSVRCKIFSFINYNNCQRKVVPWVETLPACNEIAQILFSLKNKKKMSFCEHCTCSCHWFLAGIYEQCLDTSESLLWHVRDSNARTPTLTRKWRNRRQGMRRVSFHHLASAPFLCTELQDFFGGGNLSNVEL